MTTRVDVRIGGSCLHTACGYSRMFVISSGSALWDACQLHWRAIVHELDMDGKEIIYSDQAIELIRRVN